MSRLLTTRRWLSNQPLEWTGHLQLSATPPWVPCLPLKGSVLRHRDLKVLAASVAGAWAARVELTEQPSATDLGGTFNASDQVCSLAGG
jgi:hypothetical protein